jgi:hypothetical protein
MHLSAQVSKQKCALAFSPLPVFDNFHIRPDDEVEKHVSLTAGLENGSFDLQFRLTLHGRCSVAFPVSFLPKRFSIPRQCRRRGGCSPGCAVVRLQAPKQVQGAGTDIDLAVGNRD